MNNQTMLIAIVALLLGGIGGYVIADRDGHHAGYDHHHEDDDFPMGMGHRYGAGDGEDDDFAPMGHMMDMMVASEQEFLAEMIPHHQEAVDTATEVLERGATTPEIKTLVTNIIAAQEKEIADMKSWYEDWYGQPYVDSGSYEPMMEELADLSGSALDRVFLRDMIMHHMGAIMMARSVQPYIEHEEIATLTQNIVATQSAEIAQMRQMLLGL